jgi:hypothetical protein
MFRKNIFPPSSRLKIKPRNSCLAYFPILKILAVHSTDRLVDFYQTIQRQISESSTSSEYFCGIELAFFFPQILARGSVLVELGNNLKAGHETSSKIMPIKDEDKTRVLFLCEVSDRSMPMSASRVLMEVIGFYASAIAAYPYVPATP